MIFKTQVEQSPSEIFSNFNLELFEKLNPWWNLMEIERFDGVQLNGITELRVGPFKQKFSTKIINVDKTSFADVGVELPFPFIYWEHKHIIMSNIHGGSDIVDDIIYDCSFILRPFVKLYLTMMFKYRQKVYKKIFKKNI